MNKPRIAILGTGYVGLVAAAVFAERDFDVLASSHSIDKVDTINSGRAPFFEEGLDPIVEETVRKGKLKAIGGRKEAVINSDIFFISVGTPSLMSGEADLRLIKKTASEIGEALKEKDTNTETNAELNPIEQKRYSPVRPAGRFLPVSF